MATESDLLELMQHNGHVKVSLDGTWCFVIGVSDQVLTTSPTQLLFQVDGWEKYLGAFPASRLTVIGDGVDPVIEELKKQGEN